MMPNREMGQAHLLALCLSLPVVILLVFFICQVSWVTLQQVALDHALLNIGRSLDSMERAAITGADDVDWHLKKAILADWTPLAAESLSVSQAYFEMSSIADSTSAVDEMDLIYGIRSYGQERSYMRIQALVSYRVVMLFPFPWTDDITLERKLDRTQLLSNRFEVDADA